MDVTQSTKSDPIWYRTGDFTNKLWHGDDSGFNSDARLTSPELTVSATDPLSITFDHAYSFEFDADANYDGAVIEVQVKGSAGTLDAGVVDAGADAGPPPTRGRTSRRSQRRRTRAS